MSSQMEQHLQHAGKVVRTKTAVNLYSVEHDRIDTLSSSDWELMKNLTQVLKFFYEATLDLSFDNACISIVIPLIALLNRKLQFRDENESEVMRSMKTKLHESMNRRFAYVQPHGQEPSSSYRLSPYEKDGGLWDVHDKSTSQAIQSSDASDKDDLSTQVKKNIEIYLAEPRLQRNADIYSYWDCSPFVSLRKVALKYLSAPPTTVSSEQLFSAAGQIYSDRRSNLLEKM
ncbi:Zinc finger BED domain-containing protein 4 [Eumeta japonica]|uniref:Zinc finger BED domain-containing protein 4 n=1 Tax=Eumeta variegata TaxID=151549 RepID=A0A4C1SSH7_EUMVA|nr:Zinc finger BED domain-containing protein 4 [Eumeta japonica]